MKNAFTLLELLIVLGILAILFGLGLPSMHRMYVHGQLTSTSQEIRGELYRARLDAMKTGKAYVFRYLHGTGTFEAMPRDLFDRRERDRTGAGATAVGGEPFDMESAPTPGVHAKTLPEGIVFGEVDTAPGWSTPILFFPNGRTSQASLVLRTTGRTAYRQELILRGLTGTARVVEP